MVGERNFTKAEEKKIIIPIAEKLQEIHHLSKTTIVGIQGGQGTGKTTLVQFLEKRLKKKGFKVQFFSLDDFYKSYGGRQKLQKKFLSNNFYQIPRGLPGTHRVKFLLEALKKAKAGKDFEIPIFDKSLYHGKGDILPKTRKILGRHDFIILEGWCIGIPPVSAHKFLEICKKNSINIKKIDPKLRDYRVVLNFVKEYRPLWKQLDYQIMLKADSPEVHKKWRLLQEKKLKEDKEQGMTKKEVYAFVEPFLPFTYVCYDLIRPDVKVLIDEKHNFYRIDFY